MSLKVTALIALALISTAAIAYHFTHNSNKTNEVPLVENNGSHYVPNYVLMYGNYKLKNNLKFGAAEDNKRLQTFIKNAKIIEAHNKDETSSYKLGLTPLAHLTREEFAALKLGYKSEKTTARSSTGDADITIASNRYGFDIVVDWSDKGAVTPVKNQGSCGSCWSFSATGALEGLNFIKNGKLLSFSEQQLVDCSRGYGNDGCNGGLMTQAFEYVEDNGISSEEAYPYTATDGECRQEKLSVFKNTGFEKVEANNSYRLLQAISQQPVSVAIEADSSDFQLYKSGVLTSEACGIELDHGVLAVGFGLSEGRGYYKVKNSWGASWGDQGYVLIGRSNKANDPGICGIHIDASYPTLNISKLNV